MWTDTWQSIKVQVGFFSPIAHTLWLKFLVENLVLKLQNPRQRGQFQQATTIWWVIIRIDFTMCSWPQVKPNPCSPHTKNQLHWPLKKQKKTKTKLPTQILEDNVFPPLMNIQSTSSTNTVNIISKYQSTLLPLFSLYLNRGKGWTGRWSPCPPHCQRLLELSSPFHPC